MRFGYPTCLPAQPTPFPAAHPTVRRFPTPQVYMCGDGTTGMLGQGTPKSFSTPVPIQFPEADTR